MASAYDQLMADPAAVVELPYNELFELDREKVAAFRRHWVGKRFADLRTKISLLNKLSSEHGVQKLDDVDDVLPLLCAHTVYKSYPMSYLERNRFDRLTKWLAGLITTDISHVDASGIECIDDWLDLLDRETDLRVVNSSGTTGKLSFFPRNEAQTKIMARLVSNGLRDWNGKNSQADMTVENRPFFFSN